jgi:hypothetical protein
LRGICLSFLHRPRKMSICYETVSEHVECGDIWAQFCSQIFWNFKIYFLNKGSIYTWDQKCISATLFHIIFTRLIRQPHSSSFIFSCFWSNYTDVNCGCTRIQMGIWLKRFVTSLHRCPCHFYFQFFKYEYQIIRCIHY